MNVSSAAGAPMGRFFIRPWYHRGGPSAGITRGSTRMAIASCCTTAAFPCTPSRRLEIAESRSAEPDWHEPSSSGEPAPGNVAALMDLMSAKAGCDLGDQEDIQPCIDEAVHSP